MKAFLFNADLSTVSLHAQPEGLWQGYDGECVSRQVIALAEATPPEYFAWRPALGVRSTSPHLENAVKYNPRSVGTRWSLLRLNRLLGRPAEAERVGLELVKLNPNYAPAYMGLGLTYEASGNPVKAAEAYDLYLLLAPNFADSTEVRSRTERIRAQASRPVPTLKRK